MWTVQLDAQIRTTILYLHQMEYNIKFFFSYYMALSGFLSSNIDAVAQTYTNICKLFL